eukprot:GHRR01012857.1.p1 GENE.GHRR01012857.1~~GHRR01012857.1.p1  ORF type:complete len:305 (+),score=101.83 GHRR01012857.1:165-1079(+)
MSCEAKRFSWPWPTVNDGYTYIDKISKQHVGLTVLQYYEKYYVASGSGHDWAQRIACGQVTYCSSDDSGSSIDTGSKDRSSRQPLAADAILRAGDCIRYLRLPWQEPDVPDHFDVLYEDEHVLAINKPAGLQVLPRGLICQRTLLTLLQQYHQQYRHLRYPGSLAPVPVHRLGRGTSGVLLCACTVAARTRLSRDFYSATAQAVAPNTPAVSHGTQTLTMGTVPYQAHLVAADRPLGKRYRALVTGVTAQDMGDVMVPIGPVLYPGLSTGLFAASPTGKPARSLFKVLHRHADSTLIEVSMTDQ